MVYSSNSTLTKILKSLPAAIPNFGGFYSHYMSQTDSSNISDLKKILINIEKEFSSYQNDLKKIGINSILDLRYAIQYILTQESNLSLEDLFIQCEQKLKYLLSHNFLFNENHDFNYYLEHLISNDFKNIFFSFFNKNNMFTICGREGVGKSFNSLLLFDRIKNSNYLPYISTLTNPLLTSQRLKEISSTNENIAFFIDDCQENTAAAMEIIESCTYICNRGSKHKFIFITRSFDKHEVMEMYGNNVIIFQDRFVDLNKLFKLFCEQEKITLTLDELYKNIPKRYREYKNLAFWNKFLIYIKNAKKPNEYSKSYFYNIATDYHNTHNQFLNKNSESILLLAPFLNLNIPISYDYAINSLKINPNELLQLIDNEYIQIKIQDWYNNEWKNVSEKFLYGKLHSTEHQIINDILKNNYSDIRIYDDPIYDYIDINYTNLPSLLSPLSYGYLSELSHIVKNQKVISAIQRYFKNSKLCKNLDNLILSLSNLSLKHKELLLSSEVIQAFISKIHDPKCYLSAKIYFLNSFYKFSPYFSYQIYNSISIDKMIESCKSIPYDQDGIPSFRKLIEYMKNISSLYLFTIYVEDCDIYYEDYFNNIKNEFKIRGYQLSENAIMNQISYYRWLINDGEYNFQIKKRKNNTINIYYSTSNYDDRQSTIVEDILYIIDNLVEWFIDRFDNHKYFSQFNWLLNHLDSIKVNITTKVSCANYLISKIPPDKILEWLVTKDTRINELRYLLKISRFTFINVDNETINLYHEYFKKNFTYDIIKKLLDNDRTKIYDIAIACKFSHELLAEYYFLYAKENNFVHQIIIENNIHIINEVISLTLSNESLSTEQKDYIVRVILNNFQINDKNKQKTIMQAKKKRKKLDLNKEISVFNNYRNKYLFNERNMANKIMNTD